MGNDNMNVPDKIIELVKRYKNNRQAFQSSQYNETQLRHEFIDPFFIALGWDVNNEKAYAQEYKDVIHEESIKISGTTKAPDYGFRIGGTRKFFVEAKRASDVIKEDAGASFQLRRYAWSAKLPLSILTNFEEFSVYDGRIRPAKNDKASVGRTIYVRYTDYIDQWNNISNIFSREAILKGSFDQYALSKKKGTTEVDTAFLAEIEAWREELARNLALRNSGLTNRELNYSVQATIDRIIFLRICEDRGIEEYGNLQKLCKYHNVYQKLINYFQNADAKYNSGLFHFVKEKGRVEPPDILTPNLIIDDKPLKDILNSLYYPDCPYEFSVLPADILGQVYEQFLGKVIRLTEKHRAVVENKPEVKKAGGVFYTPTYIVEYIVNNILGKLLDGKTRIKASKLKILDPACGSGSFLIKAYQYLLNWHLNWYIQNDPNKWDKGKKPTIYQGSDSGWHLTTAERKRILLNNIFGVDIDPQAVEVTKLSLLLKVLEGESSQTVYLQLQLFNERALPDLSNNIKCGNSLISSDIYYNQQLFDMEEQYRINSFDWDKEFTEIIENGGFDVVIGNPPYVRIQTTASNEIAYYNSHYKTATSNYDIYCLFVEKGVTLLKQGGKFGYILPHRFFKTSYGKGLRIFISSNQYAEQIIDFDGYMVFQNASINTCILLLKKDKQKYCTVGQVRNPYLSQMEVTAILTTSSFNNCFDEKLISGPIRSKNLSSKPWVFIWPNEETIWEKLNSIDCKLGLITSHIFQGLKTGADGIYIFDLNKDKGSSVIVHCKIDDKDYEIETAIMKPLIKGGEMKRFYLADSSKLVLFPYSHGVLMTPEYLKSTFPKAWDYLLSQKKLLEIREDDKMQGDQWYAYTRNQALTIMGSPKIITPDYYAHASYCLDIEGKYYFCGGGAGGYGIVLKPKYNYEYILGLLNSRLLDWYLHKITLRAYQTAYMYVKQYIEQLPIHTIDFLNSSSFQNYEHVITLAKNLTALYNQLSSTQTVHEKNNLQRQIDANEKQLDCLVYELYELTDKEIKIVEGK